MTSKSNRARILLAILAVFLVVGVMPAKQKSMIQVALLLDTSSSMDGLIDQARNQLWKIVNELALTKRQGAVPQLEIALYEYGNSGLHSEGGFIRRVMPLTDDLDRVSEELFALTTNGGDEYCGHVIHKAANELTWTASNDDLKIIFIAGNEPFTQGRMSYSEACKNAIGKGIIVNTIYCGNYQQGVAEKWADGAYLADGAYSNIDQNAVVQAIETPMDKELEELGRALNKTYVGYGSLGRTGLMRQEEQDMNMLGAGSAGFAERAVAKASSVYSNSSWDLVDAVANEQVMISALSDKDLPEEMRNMNENEKIEYVNKKREERESIKQKINTLRAERSHFLAEHQENDDAGSLDAAIIKSVHEQARKKNYDVSGK